MIIKEFLAQLAYRVDENSEKKFQASIRTATVQGELLGKAIAQAAETIGKSVAEIARRFDDLYYSSQRTGASVENIKGLSFAVSQLGGSYAGARSSIEAFARNLRSNPGYGSLLRNLGISTEQNGKVRDSVEVLLDLRKKLTDKPYYIQLQYANALGLDENTFRALMSGDIQRQMEEYRRRAAAVGLDNEEAAKQGNAFWNAMRGLKETIGAVADRIAQDLLPSLTSFVKDIDEFVLNHREDIQKVLRDLGKAMQFLGHAATETVSALQPLWDGFDRMAQQITGQSGLQVAFEALAVYLGGKWVKSILGAFASIGAGWSALLVRLGPLAAAIMLGNLAADTPAPWNVQEGDSPFKGGLVDRGWQWLKGKIGFGSSGGDPSSGASSGKMPAGQSRINAQESYDFWRKAGLSHEAAVGIVANEEAESGYNPGARGDGGNAHGVFQWHAPRREAIFAATGINVSRASHGDQLRAALWELQHSNDPGARAAWRALQNAKSPGEAAAIFTRLFERPDDVAGQSGARAAIANRLSRHLTPTPTDTNRNGFSDAASPGGTPGSGIDLSKVANAAAAGATPGGNVELNQTTTIQVMGSTDPTATADAVSRRQSGVNGELLRTTQGAVR